MVLWRSVLPTQPSAVIFSVIRCVVKKTSPGALTFEWLVYTERTQLRQASPSAALSSNTNSHVWIQTHFLLMQNDTKAWQGDKGPVDPDWILKKSLLLFFSWCEKKIIGALECLGTAPSIMSGKKHIISTFASLHHQVSSFTAEQL